MLVQAWAQFPPFLFPAGSDIRAGVRGSRLHLASVLVFGLAGSPLFQRPFFCQTATLCACDASYGWLRERSAWIAPSPAAYLATAVVRCPPPSNRALHIRHFGSPPLGHCHPNAGTLQVRHTDDAEARNRPQCEKAGLALGCWQNIDVTGLPLADGALYGPGERGLAFFGHSPGPGERLWLPLACSQTFLELR